MPSNDGESAERRAEVRTAAREFVSRAFPDWKMEGLMTVMQVENDYVAAADISHGDERQTVTMSVRLYVDDNEHTYWKVEQFDRDERHGAQPIKGYVIRPYQQ